MKVISVSELCNTLNAALDRVTVEHDHTIITREDGKPAAVLMSLEDFVSWQETDYLLRSPANRKALRTSIAELESEPTVSSQSPSLIEG